MWDWEILSPVAVTTLIAIALRSRLRSTITFREAALHAIDTLGFAVLFVAVNAAAGALILLVAQQFGVSRSLYVVTDTSLLMLSALQAVVFAAWGNAALARSWPAVAMAEPTGRDGGRDALPPFGSSSKIPQIRSTGAGEPGLVSVVIPTHNRAYALGACLDSVLSQSYTNLEVLVVDDGSTDDTAAVVRAYGPQVRYLYQPNAGPAAARNLGFQEARGEFIALNDSDDLWLPWKLEAQIAALRLCPDAGMVWTDCAAVDERGDILSSRWTRERYHSWQSLDIDRVCHRRAMLRELCHGVPADVADAPLYVGDLFDHMILGTLVMTSSVVLRRSRLQRSGGFDESLRPSGEDYEFHLRTAWHGPIAFLDAPAMQVRTGAIDQLTALPMEVHIARNSLTALTRWLAIAGDRIKWPRVTLRRRVARLVGWLGEAELRAADHRGARRHLWRSLCLHPAQRRRWLLLGFAWLPPFVFRTALVSREKKRRSAAAVLVSQAGR